MTSKLFSSLDNFAKNIAEFFLFNPALSLTIVISLGIIYLKPFEESGIIFFII